MYYFIIQNNKYFLNGNFQYLHSLKAKIVHHAPLPEEILKNQWNKQKNHTVKNAHFTLKYLVPEI